MKLATIALLSAVAALVAPSQTTADVRTLAELTRPTKVSAYNGLTLWNAYQRNSRRYRLVVSRGGEQETLPVTGAPTPFNGDLGPGPNGSTVAVYSRCKTSERGRRDCDLNVFDFETRRERRLKGLASRRYSEYLPTVWRRTLVFVRQDLRRPGLASVQPNIYQARLGSDSAPRRVPGGTRGRYAGSRTDSAGGPGPTSLDLRGKRLAFSWQLARIVHQAVAGRCECVRGGFG